MDELENSDIWASQIIEGELKEAINLFIWRWGHPHLTLGQAERMAISIFDMLSEQPKENEYECQTITLGGKFSEIS